MKNYLKTSLFTALLFVAATSFAQLKKPGVTLGISTFYSKPKGDFSSLYRGGLGAEVKGGVGFGKTYLVASAAYAGYATQSGNRTGTLTYVPIKVGLKQYFLAKRIFVNGDLGFAKMKSKSTEGENLFSADFGGGVRLLGLEAGIYWNSTKSMTGSGSWKTIDYKVGYNFTL